MFPKALSKQEGPKFCWNARFFNPFFEFESAACCKKGFKKRASKQTFGPSYFVRALEIEACNSVADFIHGAHSKDRNLY